jgi:hypothetical protein
VTILLHFPEFPPCSPSLFGVVLVENRSVDFSLPLTVMLLTAAKAAPSLSAEAVSNLATVVGDVLHAASHELMVGGIVGHETSAAAAVSSTSSSATPAAMTASAVGKVAGVMSVLQSASLRAGAAQFDDLLGR